MTYKICDAVHTWPPQMARPVYVKCEHISSDLHPGEVWCGQGITLLINFICDAGGLHMSLSSIELCSVAVSVVTQRCTQENIEGSSVHPRCGTNLKVW